MNLRVRVLAILTAAFVGGLLIWTTTCGGPLPYAGASRIDRPSTGEPVTGRGGSSAEGAKSLPRAVVEETIHGFGILDPAEKCEHVFLVRNEGEAPLQLSRGSTSCKCTMSDLPNVAIPPGTGAAVRIASKIAQTSGSFSHSATIFTNDPNNSSITLSIEGTIRRYVAADPPRIVLSGMRREQSKSVVVVVYSQVWENFDLEDIMTTFDGLTWRVAPAGADALEKLDARSGYRLDMSVPPGLPGGEFWETLQMSAVPRDEPAYSRTLTVDVTGKVLSRISIDHPKIDGQEVLQLGMLRGGEGVRERLIMKVRDDHRELVIRNVDTTPDFLHVHVAPHSAAAEELGLYTIEVEVPRDAPMSNFLSDKGEIRVETDHPVVPTLTLEVAFAVLGR